jgi:hypothetical protein
MIAAFCDGCLDEFVSNDRKELVDWVTAHHDHHKSFKVRFIPTVSVDPLWGIKQNGILAERPRVDNDVRQP